MRRPDQEARSVRNDQTDKPDGTTERDGGSGEQRGVNQYYAFGSLDIEAKRTSYFFAPRQYAQVARIRKGYCKADNQTGYSQPHVRPCPIRQAAH